MAKIRVQIIDIRKLPLFLIIIFFNTVLLFQIFQFQKQYFKLEQAELNINISKSSITSYLEMSMDYSMPQGTKPWKIISLNLSLDKLLRNSAEMSIKSAFGNSITAMNNYDENEELTQAKYNKSESKYNQVLATENKKPIQPKAIKDTQNNSAADSQQLKIKKINDDLKKEVQTVHSASDEKQSKIPFYKEDESTDGDPNDVIKTSLKIPLSPKSPEILIFHTHSRECYMNENNKNIKYTDNYRTNDNRYNVVRVGEEITQGLKKQGYNVIHYTGDNEGPWGVTGAYERGRKNISAILKKYPSIKVVLDIHRDCVYDDKKKVYYKFVTDINNKRCSQMMIDVSTDQFKIKNHIPFEHRNWHANLLFGAKLQNTLTSMYPGIMRMMCLSEYTYNQDLRPEFITVEIGTNANTLDESLNSADLLSNALGKLLNKAQKGV